MTPVLLLAVTLAMIVVAGQLAPDALRAKG
jgi:hypothetical protein